MMLGLQVTNQWFYGFTPLDEFELMFA